MSVGTGRYTKYVPQEPRSKAIYDKIKGLFNNQSTGEGVGIVYAGDDLTTVAGEMGKWLPFDPNPDSQAVKDSEYANEELNKMMKGYLENQEKAKLYHEQRKN